MKTVLSRFGSHWSMVVDPFLLVVQFGWHPVVDVVLANNKKVACQDEKGVYATDIGRLDDGLADPNRWSWLARNVSIN